MFWLLALEMTSTSALLIQRYIFTLVRVLAHLRSYLKDWHADMQVYQKAMSSTLTRLGPETQLRAPVRSEPLHFQFHAT